MLFQDFVVDLRLIRHKLLKTCKPNYPIAYFPLIQQNCTLVCVYVVSIRVRVCVCCLYRCTCVCVVSIAVRVCVLSLSMYVCCIYSVCVCVCCLNSVCMSTSYNSILVSEISIFPEVHRIENMLNLMRVTYFVTYVNTRGAICLEWRPYV